MHDKAPGLPPNYLKILEETRSLNFNQASDLSIGPLLASLSASKPSGKFIELGTGLGLCTAWILHGMCSNSTLTTIDNDEQLVSIAKKYLREDIRVQFIVDQGEALIQNTEEQSVDFIFADTWPGKYFYLEETLDLLKPGGIYVIDDMLPQDSWPEGHKEKAATLTEYLLNKEGFICSRLDCSTGIIICVKKN